VPLPSRPDGHDRGITVDDDRFRMVGVVIRIKAMALNWSGNNGPPWRGGTRNDKTRP
jgi:hypothetical protein